MGITIDQMDESFIEEINTRYFRQITRVDFLNGIQVSPHQLKEISIDENGLRPWVPELAVERELDYLIGGRFRHIPDNDRPGFFDGRLFRYDQNSDRFYFLNVRSAYVDLDMELNRFREQFVDPIQPVRERRRSEYVPRGILIGVGTVVVIGGAFLLYRGVGASGGNGGGPGPGPVN